MNDTSHFNQKDINQTCENCKKVHTPGEIHRMVDDPRYWAGKLKTRGQCFICGSSIT